MLYTFIYMAGHSKWKQIKHKKAVTDEKKAKVFSKMIRAITVAAREEPDPTHNPRLRTLIEKARKENIPNENIERALQTSKHSEALYELTIEAYGPEKTAFIIEAITNNTNRTIAEIRTLLQTCGVKMADQGSVLWLFERSSSGAQWQAKFKKELPDSARSTIQRIIATLEQHPDIQTITTDCIE